VLADGFSVGGFGLAVGGCIESASHSLQPWCKIYPSVRTKFCVVIPRNACIVDQKVDAIRLLGRKVLCELNSTLSCRNVAGKRMQATRASVVCLDCVLEDLLSPSGDVDLRSVRDEGLCDHEANACASAGDDGGDVRDIE